MSYTSLTSAQTTSGKPVTTDIMDLVRTNLDDHESRIGVVEGAATTVSPIIFDVSGMYYQQAIPLTDVARIRIPFNLTLLAGLVYVPLAGSSGTLDVDVQMKRGAGAFATIFSVRPTKIYSAGDGATGTGTLSTVDLLLGDQLRLDIQGVQVGNLAFTVYLLWQGA